VLALRFFQTSPHGSARALRYHFTSISGSCRFAPRAKHENGLETQRTTENANRMIGVLGSLKLAVTR